MSNLRGRVGEVVDRIRNVPGLGRNIMSLALLMLLGIGAGGYILSNQRFTPPWQDDTLVWASFQEAPAVAPGQGQEVRIAGVPVGDVRDDRIGPDGHAQLLLAIDQSQYAKPIYRNATVVLRAKSPLNEMYINVDPGGPPSDRLPQNGVLPMTNTKAPVPIDQSLSHLDEDTRDALHSLLSTSDVALARADRDLPPGLRATQRVLDDLRPVMQQLDLRRNQLKTMITSVSRMSAALGADDGRLATLANSLQATLSTLDKRSDSLRSGLDELPGFLDQLNSATGSVQTLSGQLNPTLDNVRAASDSLPGSLSGLTKTMHKLDFTMSRARPVARKLGPVAADLRPFIAQLNPSLVDAKGITNRLDHFTGGSIPYLTDLKAFVHQSGSITSLGDANGGILRGILRVGPSTLPLHGTDKLSTPAR